MESRCQISLIYGGLLMSFSRRVKLRGYMSTYGAMLRGVGHMLAYEITFRIMNPQSLTRYVETSSRNQVR